MTDISYTIQGNYLSCDVFSDPSGFGILLYPLTHTQAGGVVFAP